MAHFRVDPICSPCQENLEHCHGTAIVHFDGAWACSDDPDCRLVAEVHRFVVACDEDECRTS